MCQRIANPKTITGNYSTSGALTHPFVISTASPQASTIYEFLSVAGRWPCCLTPHILQSSHISGWGEKKKEKLVCATFSDTMTRVQTWKWIGKKSNIQRSHSQVSWRRKHSQPEEGWGPIQVTQPRHNLQVSFHQYINWSAFKVIQTRVQQHGKRCVCALRITLEQSLKTGGKAGGYWLPLYQPLKKIKSRLPACHHFVKSQTWA